MKSKNRILLVDDNEAIHEDIRAILSSEQIHDAENLRDLEHKLFGSSTAGTADILENIRYRIDHAYQGEEAIRMVKKAAGKSDPYSLIFMDVRMPPGMDGIETVQKIWKDYPYTEIVICTAYSDYSWNEIIHNLGSTDKLLFMKKPFDATALKQTALTLTTKWQLQQESVRYTEKLEREVEERTRKLNKVVEELKRLKDEAEKTASAKSAFLANMSHEIRTPMNGIMGMNDLLLETDLTDEQRELSEMVKKSAKSLLRVINDILDFSKIEAEKLKLENVPFRVKELIHEIVQITSFSISDKRLSVSYTIDDDIPEFLNGDPMRIRQILMNYGSNAVKFTDKGEISFSVELLEAGISTCSLKFSVQDTGPGIPVQKQTVIFDSFTQADPTTTRKYGGTGLGLAICRQLAELMNGEVGVDSKADEGSVFWFAVTLEKFNKGNTINGDPDFHSAGTFETSSKRLKVLVAEDNKINQLVARKILEKEGFEVHITETGTETVKAVKNNEFAYVFMDIQMPEMDGYEVTSAIRKWEKGTHRHVPIIALTASAMEEDREKCINAGMDEFVSKPVDREELLRVLNKTARAAYNTSDN